MREKKLVILLTQSPYDWGSLNEQPYNKPLIMDASNGRRLAPKQLPCSVLAVVKREGDPRLNTRAVSNLMNRLGGYETITLVHPPVDGRELSLKKWINTEDSIVNLCLNVAKYSTADEKVGPIVSRIVEAINKTSPFIDDFMALWNAFLIPWRYEYYIEIALRLLKSNNAENCVVINKIVLGQQPTSEDRKLEEISNSYDSYESKCGELGEEERTKLLAVQLKIQEQIFNQLDLMAWELYRQSYQEIIGLLQELAIDEIAAVRKTRIRVNS